MNFNELTGFFVSIAGGKKALAVVECKFHVKVRAGVKDPMILKAHEVQPVKLNVQRFKIIKERLGACLGVAPRDHRIGWLGFQHVFEQVHSAQRLGAQ